MALYSYEVQGDVSNSLLAAPVACRLFMYAAAAPLKPLGNFEHLDQGNEVFGLLTALNTRLKKMTAVYSVTFWYIDVNNRKNSTTLLDKAKFDKCVDEYNVFVDAVNSYLTGNQKTRSNTLQRGSFEKANKNLEVLFKFSDVYLRPLNNRKDSTKLKLFVAVHNSLALQKTKSNLMYTVLNQLRTSLNNAVAGLQDLHDLHLILWQSLLVNPTAKHMHEYLNKDLFGKNMKTAFSMFKDTSTFNIETDTGIFTQDKLYSNYVSRKPMNSARLVKTLGSVYWSSTEPLFDTKSSKHTLIEAQPAIIDNRGYMQSPNTLGKWLDKLFKMTPDQRIVSFPLCSTYTTLGVQNQIATSMTELLQGQIISFTSTYGTLVDLLVKNFVELQTNGQHKELASLTMQMMHEMPRLVIETARVVATTFFNTPTQPFDLSNANCISTSCPGFLFGLNFGKNVVGIHADSIFYNGTTLYVGELKTKWAQKELGGDGGFMKDGAILNDHLHQCLCQAIVAYCMYGDTNWGLCTELLLLAVPLTKRVTTLYTETHRAVIDDEGVCQLACNLYASTLLHFFIYNKSTFSGFSDVAYFVDKKSQFMLWVVACLIKQCELQCFILLPSREVQTLPQPTFASIRIGNTTPGNIQAKGFTFTANKTTYTAMPLFTNGGQYAVCYNGPLTSTFKTAFESAKKKLKILTIKKSKFGIILITVAGGPGKPIFPESLILFMTTNTFDYVGVYLKKPKEHYDFADMVTWFKQETTNNTAIKSGLTDILEKKKSTQFSLTHVDSLVSFYDKTISVNLAFTLSASATRDLYHARWFVAYYVSDETVAKQSWLYNYVINTGVFKGDTITLKNLNKKKMPDSVLVPVYTSDLSEYAYFIFQKQPKTDTPISTTYKKLDGTPSFSPYADTYIWGAPTTARTTVSFKKQLEPLFPKGTFENKRDPQFGFQPTGNNTYTVVKGNGKGVLNYVPNDNDLKFVRSYRHGNNTKLLQTNVEGIEHFKMFSKLET